MDIENLINCIAHDADGIYRYFYRQKVAKIISQQTRDSELPRMKIKRSLLLDTIKSRFPEAAIKELNECKDENLNITKESANIKSDLMMTYLLGQCPVQLFKKSHPQYQAKNTENNFNKIIFKKDVKSLAYKEFL